MPVPIVSRTASASGRSELALRLVLPEDGGEMVLEDAAGWRRTRVPGPLPEAWRTTALHRRLRDREPRSLLDEAGDALGTWLFDREASDLLAARVAAHEDGGPPLRLELQTGDARAGWPWELARLPGLGPLGVHPVLTLVRRPISAGACAGGIFSGSISPGSISPGSDTSTAPMLTVEVVGTSEREDLDQVRREIEAVGEHGRLAVRLDALGDFSDLARRYVVSGPPHVIHFDAARTFPFQSADELANLLTRTAREDRRTQLVCLQTEDGTASLAHRLVQLGVPLAACWEDVRSGHEARTMVAAFYRALAGGEAIDVAMQTARRRLFEIGGVAWAFATLHAHGPCRPLLRPTEGAVWRPSAGSGSVWNF